MFMCWRSKTFVVSTLISLLFLLSCVDARKAIYFNNVQDTTFRGSLEDIQPIIHPNDVLSISVSSLNPEATAIFNTPNLPINSGSVTTASTSLMGYLVSEQGSIQFPVLGTMKVVGLTKKTTYRSHRKRIDGPEAFGGSDSEHPVFKF